MLAPVVLFVYNRPLHTQQTVEALQRNDLAPETELFVFADGPRNKADADSVARTRDYVSGITGFAEVHVVEREHNLGLANSVIGGVTDVIGKFGKVIVMEDDLVSSSQFLSFMNQSLDRYADNQDLFSVSGFSFPIRPPDTYPYDAYCSRRSMSWSWGTWLDRWQQADWEVTDYPEFRRDRARQRAFNRGGDDLSDLLALQMKDAIDSWSIVWDFTHYLHNAYCLCPTVSRIVNIGFDGSGAHGVDGHIAQDALREEAAAQFRFPEHLPGDEHFIKEIARIHRYSLSRRGKSFIKRHLLT